MFMRGHLDSCMVDKVKSLDPSFQFDDLRFIREEILAGVLTGDTNLPAVGMSTAQRAKIVADFELLKVELQGDVLAFKRYMSEVMQHDDHDAEATVAQLEAEEDMVNSAVEKRREAYYRVSSFADHSFMTNFFTSSLVSFAAMPPTFTPGQVLRLNLVNAAGLGPQASCVLPSIAQHIASDHAHNAAHTMAVVVLPNTPEWGKGRGSAIMVEEDARPSALWQASLVLAQLNLKCSQQTPARAAMVVPAPMRLHCSTGPCTPEVLAREVRRAAAQPHQSLRSPALGPKVHPGL